MATFRIGVRIRIRIRRFLNVFRGLGLGLEEDHEPFIWDIVAGISIAQPLHREAHSHAGWESVEWFRDRGCSSGRTAGSGSQTIDTGTNTGPST